MSWYRDPQLFIYSYAYVYRVTKEFGIYPLVGDDVNKEQENLTFSKHLSLANNKESDFEAFKASFPSSGITKLINSQGLVINWDLANQRGIWSRKEPNSPFWSLPGITLPKSAIEQALEEKVSNLEAKISSLEGEVNSKKLEKEAVDKIVLDLEAENAILKAEAKRERDEKSALINGLKREEILVGLEGLEKQVSSLTSKLDQCCGAAGSGSSVEEPWMSAETVRNDWVPFEELDFLAFTKNTPLTITKAPGGPKIRDDNSSNVLASRFYGGIFPIVLVDVAELTPSREEARFDPRVWGSYNNAGISYAARKPFASEMSFDAHKSC